MKKLALTLTLLTGIAATSAFGQGAVNFTIAAAANDVYTNATLYINGSSTGLSGSGLTTSQSVGSGFYFALLGQNWSGTTVHSTYTSILTDGWLYSGVLGTPSLSAGRMSGGNPASTTAGFAMPGGNQINNQFLMVGWSSNLGSSWATISGDLQSGNWNTSNNAPGFFGISATGTGLTSITPQEIIFGGTGIAGFTTLYVTPAVPEPSTLVLAGLGGLSLLLFRRRK